MAYRSRTGRRPDEKASKAMHSHIVNDDAVAKILKKCKLPPLADDVDVQSSEKFVEELAANPIEHIFSFDGGYTETRVRDQYPSSNLAFLQFGALHFTMADLQDATEEPFISPAAIQKLKQIDRYKLPLPTKNLIYDNCGSFAESFRTVLHEFCQEDRKRLTLNDTLRWLMYEEYRGSGALSEWSLASCPICKGKDVVMRHDDVVKDGTTKCSNCGERLYLTDAFRLHEILDEELGASGVLGFLTVALEQILMIAVIRYIFEEVPEKLSNIMFVKDGPLAFFGQTANFQKPTRKLFNYIRNKGYPLYVVGVEKSGPFVEHAFQIKNKMKPGSYMILSNDYIYRYVLPTNKAAQASYGSTTYYGNKIIYKSKHEDILVISLPTKQVTNDPVKSDFDNIDVVLTNLTTLRCDSFDSSLIPIAIVNKLVSLSNHPSSDILTRVVKTLVAKN